MPPPELPTHVPIANLGEPVFPRLLKVRRNNLRCTRARCGKCLLGERLGANEPLRSEARLQDVVAALAARRVRRVWLHRHKKSELFECSDDRLTCLEPIHTGEWRWGVGNDARGLIEDGGRRQVVPKSNLAVVRIVGWCDLHRAGAEAHLDESVGNHGNRAVHERHHHALPNECGVARIVGVHSHACVTKERLWSCRRHHHAAGDIAPFKRVANLPDAPLLFGRHRLKIRDARLAAGAPADERLAAIGEAALVERCEGGAHGAARDLVHGESSAAPIGRRAEALELTEDGVPCFVHEAVHAVEVALAAQIGAAAPLLLNDAIEHVLRRNRGVIDTGEPESRSTLHARAAHHQVFERHKERVPYMQATRDIRRRHDDRERWK